MIHPGILETVWNQLEFQVLRLVGMGKFTQPIWFKRAVDGVFMLSYYDMFESDQACDQINKQLPGMDWVEGNNVVSIRADIGGFVPQVELQSVDEGWLVGCSIWCVW